MTEPSARPTPIRAGTFESESRADRAVSGLLAAGFTQQRISVVSVQPLTQSPQHSEVRLVAPSGAHTAGGVAAGGAIGSVLGGLTAAVGVVATGGMALLAVGPLLGAMTGGVFGGFVGAMLTRGFEPEIADYFDQALREGQYLVAVEFQEGGPTLETADEVFHDAGVESLPLRKS